MNRNQAKELLPFIQAFAEGRPIQYRMKDIKSAKWNDIDKNYHEFSPHSFQYRIKPELKYRPFANAEECWNEMLKHQPFGYVYFADDNLYHNIIMLAPEQGCHEAYIRIGNCTVRGLEETFRIATFADGTPFGVKEEK